MLLSVTLATASLLDGESAPWQASFVNEPTNARHALTNPVRISYNNIHDHAVADVDYTSARGDYHDISSSGDAYSGRGSLQGLKRLGRWDMQGHIAYCNLQQQDQRWDTRLWNEPTNPYYVCDSVPGDASTEAFDLGLTLSYRASDQWTWGIDAALRTGSRADQSDPRPRTTAMVIPVTLGAERAIGQEWHLGLAAGVQIYSSVLEYYTVQPLNNHRYFVMKGMGDYLKRSTGDDSGYQRDYKGLSMQGALHAVWADASQRRTNVVEAAMLMGDEDATDGGSSYSFDGGAYAYNTLTVTDWFTLRTSTAVQHRWALRYSMLQGKGTWSDQKRETDSEHGNIAYYVTLSKSVNHKVQSWQTRLSYTFDHFRSAQRDLFASADISLSSMQRTNYLGASIPRQEYQLLTANLSAGRCLPTGRSVLWIKVNGGYTHPLSRQFASGSLYTGTDDISAHYTAPLFEYQTSRQVRLGAVIDWCLPISAALSTGLCAQYQCQRYADSDYCWTGYDGTALHTLRVSAYLRF